MANWKKVGAAWATGGASIAYEKAKQRKANEADDASVPPPASIPAQDADSPAAPAAPPTASDSPTRTHLEEVAGTEDTDVDPTNLSDADDEDAVEGSSDGFDLPAQNADVGAQVSKLKKRVKRSLQTNLNADETIHVVIRGAHGQAIVGTGGRVFVLKPGFMAGASFGTEVTSWSYRTIAGVQVHKGLMSGAVVIQAPGQSGVNTSYWGNSKDDPSKAPNAIPVVGDWGAVQQAAAQLRTLIDAAHAPVVHQPQTAPETSLASELGKLADLRTAGVLSDEEFTAAKQRLLAS